MRLLHITATHLSLAGGIPVVLRDLVEAQNKIDDLEAMVLSVKADIAEMKSQYFDTLSGTSFSDYIDHYCPDLVIFHSHYYFEYLKLYRYLVKKRIPYLIEPHGSFGKAALQKSKYKKIIANKFLLRHFMHHAKGYIFLNNSEMKDAQFSTVNDLIIPNGIADKDIKPLGEYNKKWFIYFIGRFDINHKGLDYLFDALDILDRDNVAVPIKLFGKGDKEAEDYISSRIKKYKYISVSNCGAIYGEEQMQTLEQCGIMILTSRYEGFPMTILEAWKYGNPCIVTPGTNVITEVNDNSLGWGVSLSASSIAQGILKALKEYPMKREEYINRCKKYVCDNYSWKKIALNSYKEISKVLKS